MIKLRRSALRHRALCIFVNPNEKFGKLSHSRDTPLRCSSLSMSNGCVREHYVMIHPLAACFAWGCAECLFYMGLFGAAHSFAVPAWARGVGRNLIRRTNGAPLALRDCEI